MTLSLRLSAVASMVTPGLRVADVGCDHGYLAIHLISNNISPHVIAMDVNRGPLDRAEKNVGEAGLEDDIELRLSDGLCKVDPGEVDSVVMAGMGGLLMINIIENSSAVCDKLSEMILQPQSEVAKVRHYLVDNGYRIISEDIVYEDEKFYPMMKVIHGDMYLEKDVYYRFGKILLHEEHPVLRQYLRYERHMLLNIRDELLKADRTEKVEGRLLEIAGDIAAVDEAIAMSDRISPVAIDRILE